MLDCNHLKAKNYTSHFSGATWGLKDVEDGDTFNLKLGPMRKCNPLMSALVDFIFEPCFYLFAFCQCLDTTRINHKFPTHKKSKPFRFFPDCVARVSVSLWGSGSWGCVRATLCPTVRNCPQPFATVRNRLQPFARSPYGRTYGKFCRRGQGSFLEVSNVALLRFAWQVWHFVTFLDVFGNVLEVVLCGGRNTFATFSQDELQLSWQAQHFRRVACFLRIALPKRSG